MEKREAENIKRIKGRMERGLILDRKKKKLLGKNLPSPVSKGSLKKYFKNKFKSENLMTKATKMNIPVMRPEEKKRDWGRIFLGLEIWKDKISKK